MHIEITGRMTGKTTRLIAAANKKRQEGKKGGHRAVVAAG